MKKLLILSAVAVMLLGGASLSAGEKLERSSTSTVSTDDERCESGLDKQCGERYELAHARVKHERAERAHKRWHKKQERCDRVHERRGHTRHKGHGKREHSHRDGQCEKRLEC